MIPSVAKKHMLKRDLMSLICLRLIKNIEHDAILDKETRQRADIGLKNQERARNRLIEKIDLTEAELEFVNKRRAANKAKMEQMRQKDKQRAKPKVSLSAKPKIVIPKK